MSEQGSTHKSGFNMPRPVFNIAAAVLIASAATAASHISLGNTAVAALAQSEVHNPLLGPAASDRAERELTNMDAASSLQSEPLHSIETSKHDIIEISLEARTGSLPIKFLREDALENWLDLSLGRKPQPETAKVELSRPAQQPSRRTETDKGLPQSTVTEPPGSTSNSALLRFRELTRAAGASKGLSHGAYGSSSGTKRKQMSVTAAQDRSSLPFRPGSGPTGGFGTLATHSTNFSWPRTSAESAKLNAERHEQTQVVESAEVQEARKAWGAASSKSSKLRFSQEPLSLKNAARLAKLDKEDRKAGLAFYNLKWPDTPWAKSSLSFDEARKATDAARNRVRYALQRSDTVKEPWEWRQLAKEVDEAQRQFAAARIDPDNAEAQGEWRWKDSGIRQAQRTNKSNAQAAAESRDKEVALSHAQTHSRPSA